MRHAQRAEQGQADPRHLAGRQRAAAGQPVVEGRAVDQLHDDPGARVLFDDVVHDDHVRMLDPRDGPGLAHGARPLRAGRAVVQVQFLDRDLAAQHLVGGAPDRSHAAAAEPFAQAVAAGDEPALAPQAPHGVILPQRPGAGGGCRGDTGWTRGARVGCARLRRAPAGREWEAWPDGVRRGAVTPRTAVPHDTRGGTSAASAAVLDTVRRQQHTAVATGQ